jgi:hypothetical protein
MITIQPENPYSKEEILSCLTILQKEVDLFFSTVNPNYFFSHSLGGWSPGENLSHLSFATNILALSLKLPRIYYRFFYGKPKQEKSFLEWRSLYQETMKHPRDAGFYSPALVDSPKDKVSQIQSQNKEWNTACLSLTSSLERLSDSDLSGYRISHPHLGKVSFREMCFLQILHILHHCGKVEEKLKNTSKVSDFV